MIAYARVVCEHAALAGIVAERNNSWNLYENRNFDILGARVNMVCDWSDAGAKAVKYRASEHLRIVSQR
jgi:hypothetical protein